MLHLVSGMNFPKNFANLSMIESLSLSSHLSLTSLSSSPSLLPLSLCITPSLFHSRLKTNLFHKSFPPYSLPHLFRQISQIFMTISRLNCSLVFLLFCSFHLFLFDSCDRLSWFYQLLTALTSMHFAFLNYTEKCNTTLINVRHKVTNSGKISEIKLTHLHRQQSVHIKDVKKLYSYAQYFFTVASMLSIKRRTCRPTWMSLMYSSLFHHIGTNRRWKK